ncbi:cysteine-rich receptor-like protein kinase 41 [Rhododendron vialii]|uniref:cysteine-rich receptor-like protein kinase 41 n=1 Tax=Rhododendron vialii TaxID=182163 RepID=UPI00265EFD85|nr:cysteine-rich receptor-like protein kinase 41 [Rhododendron vialii]XP_058187712.1 cysteine-rich receptor-like protein kinase 41 [Rhododendron vialii]XP_058187713.1 cysteine-rich receptor-like protein kinase 41 [Rhododendron vialii]
MSTGDGGNQSGGEFCRRYSLAEIQWATHNFDDALLIGKGGFGKVYKGFMNYGATVLAIKRLNTESKQGAQEFWSEIKTLSMLRHPHLVTLIGYSDDCEEMILVYEYMANGTLADHLYKIRGKGNSNTHHLTWKERLQICINAARGLDYLHNTEQGVIHRDVKTTNILLDENWVAKIADFGLSKMGITQTHVSTDVKGTFGYLDPEYFLTRRLTKKSDVYAFGVVLFEVLCARPPVDMRDDNNEEQRSLPLWAQQCIKKGMLDQIIDPYLRGQIPPKCLKLFVKVANKCLHKHPQGRPTMAEVEGRLKHILVSYGNIPKGTKSVSKVMMGCACVPAHGIILAMMSKNHNISRYGSENEFPRRLQRDPFKVTAARLYRRFKLAQIQAATNNFHENLVIGDVGYTRVYRGLIDRGTTEVAIRRWKEGKSRERNLDQFTAEIQVQSQLRHHHIVPLVGYCNDKNELILVYEYMVNKSLHYHLYEPNRGSLPWEKRLEICIGVARGLQYLHTGTKQTIIHHNLKPTSILLDENWAAKLSSLEFSVVLPTNGLTATCSTFVAGNVGYMDPEYVASSKLTIKTDVYSFGVILLEVLCGRKTMVITRDEAEVNLVHWFKTNVQMGTINGIIDPVLVDTIAPECLKEYVVISETCLRGEGIERPSMDAVVGSLWCALQLQEAWLNKPHETIPRSHNQFSDGSVIVDIPGKGRSSGMILTSLEDSTYLSGNLAR